MSEVGIITLQGGQRFQMLKVGENEERSNIRGKDGSVFTRTTVLDANGKQKVVYINTDKPLGVAPPRKKVKEENFSKWPLVGTFQRACSGLADILDTGFEMLAPKLSSKNKTNDGKDDGNLGCDEILWCGLRAVKNGLTGMLRNPVKTLAVAATVTVATMAFPALGTGLLIAGAIGGGAVLLGGAVQAKGAKTDAEARAGWEKVWTGGITMVTSLVGLKKMGAAKRASMNAAKQSQKTQLAADAKALARWKSASVSRGDMKTLTAFSKMNAAQRSTFIKAHPDIAQKYHLVNGMKTADVQRILGSVRATAKAKAMSANAALLKKNPHLAQTYGLTKNSNAQAVQKALGTIKTEQAQLNAYSRWGHSWYDSWIKDIGVGASGPFTKGAWVARDTKGLLTQGKNPFSKGSGATLDKMRQLETAYQSAQGSGQTRLASKYYSELKAIGHALKGTSDADEALTILNQVSALRPSFRRVAVGNLALQGAWHSALDDTTSLDGKDARSAYDLYISPEQREDMERLREEQAQAEEQRKAQEIAS